jgi:hypothetical protein
MVIGVLPGHNGRIGHHDHTHFIGQTPVESGRPNSSAICGPEKRKRRNAQIVWTVCGGVRVGELCGRELRSINPSAPSTRHRASHLNAVRLDTPAASAAA